MSAAEGRRFAFTVGLAFLLLGGVLSWRGLQTASLISAALGGSLLLAGLIAPGHLGGIHARWMAMALLISKVTTPLLMSAIFFLVMTPIGLLRRAIGKNPLVHAPANGSFWKTTAAATGRRGSMLRQF